MKNEHSNKIFQFLYPTNNDFIANMKSIDLQELLLYLEDYNLELRDNINISKKITMGLELEFENANMLYITKQIKENKDLNNWQIKKDLSLHKGGEITSPILKDTKTNWKKLEKTCSIIKKNARIGKNSGGHIHVGVQALGQEPKYWLNFIKIWSVYENIIYRFTYGEENKPRASIVVYAKPIANRLWQDYHLLNKMKKIDMYSLIETIAYQRKQAVNFNNVSVQNMNKFEANNTIEFRCPNGTLNSIIWQNNANLLIKLLQYAKSSDFNHDIIDKRHSINTNKYQELYWYSEIFLQQSLELCDMIFDNNLDKIYFLKQYLKDFNTSPNTKTKSLTK